MTPAGARRSLVFALLLVAFVARADDDKPEAQRMRFVERGDSLTVSASITKLFDEAAFRQLDSGFTSTIVISLAVYSEDGGEPLWGRLVTRSVWYDLWDEVYTLDLEGPKPVKVKSPAEALKLLTAIDDVPIAPLADIPMQQIYFLKVTAQLNPVDKATLAEVRRWLSQGTGGGLDRGGVFFGSFVSVFVNPKIAEADRVLRLRSQPFFRPKP